MRRGSGRNARDRGGAGRGGAGGDYAPRPPPMPARLLATSSDSDARVGGVSGREEGEGVRAHGGCLSFVRS
jgi:hypothetical protein